MQLSAGEFNIKLIRKVKNYLMGIPQYEIALREYANKERVLVVKNINEERTVRAYNLNDLYRDYRKGASFEGIALEISESIKEDGKDFKSLLAEYESLNDYSRAKGKLVVAFATANLTNGDLKQFPHKKIGSMNLLVCASINDVVSEQQYLLPITMDRFRLYGVSKEDFFDNAIRNTEFRNNLTTESFKMKYDDSLAIRCVELSYEDNEYGASCMVDDSSLEAASESFGGGNFYILPASIKSFVAVEDIGIPLADYLQDALAHYNLVENEPYEKISDKCFFYDSIDKSFTDAERHDFIRYGRNRS